MSVVPAVLESDFHHCDLENGIELAVDRLPERNTVALAFRMLVGLADDPPELTGITSIVERTLAKGMRHYSGQELADAFDAIGASWSTASGRQTTLLRVLCLPEFVNRAVELAAEMFCRPTFPDEACRVAVHLAQEELKHLDDDPYELLNVDLHRLAFGPVFGRNPDGEPETLPRITPQRVREHWGRFFRAGRLQVAAAGPVHPHKLSRQVAKQFAGLEETERAGRAPADFAFRPARHHRAKDLKQQYMALTLPGAAKEEAAYPVEQVLLGVLSGGMSARLFTEVREKQGLVYWVSAWSEQPRGRGFIHLGASTTPERCDQTFATLLRELERLGEDLTEEETTRARDGLVAQMQTEHDLTRARAASLTDDLFHFGRPIGPAAKVEALRQVGVNDVATLARDLRRDALCVATVGPRELK